MLTENHDFNEIYERYKNLVLKVAYLYSNNYEVAEDITQETFLRLYKNTSEKKLTNAKAWLCTVAKHLALNYLKKAARELLVLEEGAKDSGEEKADVYRESVETEYLEELTERERSELNERILQHLMEKNPRWYEAIMLVGVAEYSQVEAARKMNMSEDAFYVMLYRARCWIKKNYGAEYKELNRQ